MEQSYRLYDDTEAFELLQTLTVNLVEEEPQIRQTAETLTENLTQDDTVGEAIQALTGEEWFDTLMPKLREGQRSYYLDGDGELYFQVGYGADGAKVTKVWYTAGGRSIFLQNTENTLKIVICTGDAIVSYYLDAGTGSITREQGTMKNDVLTGEYTCDISSGENGVDLFSLWNNRGELEYTTYQGEFDDEGKTLLEQPGEAELKKLLEGSGYQKAVLYAYDASTGRCLWQGLDSDATVESYSFGGDMLGLQSVPEYSAYEAQPMAEQNAEETSGAGADGAKEGSIEPGSSETTDNIARVRVFDGEIQWYDGKYWVSAGKAADLIQEDPFLAYEERENASGTQVASTQSAEGAQPGESGENGSSAGEIKVAAGNKNTGTVTLASNKPAADNKNKTGTTTTAKPAATPKPSTTNKPSSTTNTAGSSSGSGSSSGGSTNSGGNSSSGGSSSSGGGSSSGGSTNSGGNSSSGGGSGSDSGSSSGGSSGSDSGSSSGGSGSDSGSSSGGSSSDSGSSSGGGSGSDSGGSSGGDVDVDWSPDIM